MAAASPPAAAVSTSPGVPARPPLWAWALLGLQMLAVAGGLWRTGRLAPQIVRDTAGYADFPWDSVRGALTSIRTPGYPAFLKVASLFGGEHAAVPTLQTLVYFAAAALFFAILRRAAASTWIALAAASSLLYANILHGYVATVATDTLAAALGILACAATIAFAARGGLWSGLLLGACAMAAWLVRPAYLFVIVLCPLLAGLAAPLVARGTVLSRRSLILRTGLLVAIPLLAYCGLRGALVGQFGIVSFGGYNLVGITGQFLTEEDIPHLPDNLRAIGHVAKQAREMAASRGPYGHEPRLHYLRMETEYDPTIWDDYVVAENHAESNGLSVNESLGRIGVALLLRHPRDYAVWLVKATRQGAKKLAWDFLDNPVALVVVGLLAGAVLCRLLLAAEPWPPFDPGLKVLVGLALLYALLNLAVVIPVCPPLGRFTDAAGVFLGAPVFAGLVSLVVQRRQARGGT